MKEKSKSEVSIIGGADGPTSIFIAGRRRKKSYGKDRRYPVCYGRFIHKDRRRSVSSKRSAQPAAQGGIGRTAKRDAETLPETGSSAEEGREKISGGM